MSETPRPAWWTGRRAGRAASWLLFIGSVAVVIWQNSRATVLLDVAYILEHAQRIAAGDVPYRDFPLPHVPGTFLIQALVIKIFGAVYLNHVIYAALLSGAATVVTQRILELLLEPLTAAFRPMAALLAASLMVLGIYAIYPQPFYDSDACLFVLLALWALLAGRRAEPSRVLGLVAGLLIAVPIFLKQNIGLAAFGLVHLALLLELPRGGSAPRRRYPWVLAGSALGLVAALAAIAHFIGLGEYVEWTLSYAFRRRMPGPAHILATYRDPVVWFWIASMAAGLGLLWKRGTSRVGRSVALLLMLLPMLWVLPFTFGLRTSSLFPLRNLLSTWSWLLVLCVPAAVAAVRAERLRLESLLPLLCAGVAHAALLSQGLWGSTFGIWPLFIIGCGALVGALLRQPVEAIRTAAWPFAIGLAGCLLVSGAAYAYSNNRLSYVDIEGPTLQASRHPRLLGMVSSGEYLSRLDDLLEFCEREIPAEDAVITLPGEDPFFYALGRRPKFPVLLFEHSTVNPYSDEEIVVLARQRDVRWIVVKTKLQYKHLHEELGPLLKRLSPGFSLAYRSDGYRVLKRVEPPVESP